MFQVVIIEQEKEDGTNSGKLAVMQLIKMIEKGIIYFRMFMCWGTQIISVTRGKIALLLTSIIAFFVRENHYILKEKKEETVTKGITHNFVSLL